MSVHKPVLLEESIEALNIKSGDTVVDATLGGGGHSREILKKIMPEGALVAIDADSNAIEKFKIQNSKFKNERKVFLVNDNFSNLDSILKELEIKKVNAILADFGISSDQLEETDRGFSFQKNARLDMRMNQLPRITNQYEYTNGENLTAEKIVNSYSEEELIRIFQEYGEEKYAKSIAREIVKQRKIKPVETTFDLVLIIENSVPERYKHQKIHFATKVFQALRIETNKELEAIGKFIPKAIEILDKKGRLAVITFHSGEDKIAKEIFRKNARGCICPPNFPVCRCGKQPVVKIITKKPVLPTTSEIKNNPRSRSAKLRVIEKI